MNELTDALEETLSVVEKEREKLLPAKKLLSRADQHLDDDYTFTRDTLRSLVEVGTSSLDTLQLVCQQTEHPRAYEVLSKAIKDIADTVEKLMNLQSKMREVDGTGTKKSGSTTNNVYVGSTTDLQRFLKARDAGEDVDDAKIVSEQ